MKTINSLRSKLLALTLALMASVSSFAYDYHGDLLCYNILTDSTVAVTGQSEYKTMPRYEYLPENLVIPAEVTLQGKAYKVVSIDQWAFYACAMLKSVTIPSSVTFIGMSAFHYCENLVYVDIPTSVTTVEGSAFSYTKWYDNLPDGEVYINNTLYRYKGTAPENAQIVVKDGTTRIAGYTFWNQSNIVSIELPQTLTVIEHDAFEGCTQLSSILIPKNVTDIGASAFADCTGLTEVICLAPTPPTMGQYANPSADSEIFARVDVSNTTLYVRSESVEAYKNVDQWKDFGQILPIETTLKEQFPFLAGLQRTDVELSTIEGDVDPYHLSFKEYTPTLVNGKLYLCDGRNYFREENNQVLLYAPYLGMEEDLVLYDWTLEVGDTLPYKPKRYTDEQLGMLFRVTDVSTIQLLDGKEYKKWTFSGGYEFVEGIGAINKGFGHFNCLRHTIHTGMSAGERLVCASRNGQLLIDNTEKWGVECQCEIETSYKSQWCNTWNVFMHTGWADLDTERTWQYKLDRDTIINEKLYTTVIYYLTSDPSQEYYMGAVRFGDDRKVYRAIGNSESVVYDFTAQVGDTLGPGVVYDVEVDSLTNLKTIYFHPYDRYEDEYIEYATVTWIEGVGSTDGFLLAKDYGTVGGASFYLLCAYRDDELKYAANKDLGCRYNAGEVTHDHFPTLAGLSRTIYEERNTNDTTRRDDFTKVVLDRSFPTLYHSQMYLRERDNKIFVESRTYKNLTELYEYVLYDFTLEVGDSLPMLYIDYYSRGNWGPTYPLSILNVVNYRKEADGTIYPGDTLIVTEVSTITLLDGKEYKKWTFNNGMEYAEGIGSLSGDFYELIANKRTTEDLTASHLVCVSRNGQLLYQMDEAEMERLGAECLCEYTAELTPEDLFPTLWGLQRTDVELHTTGDNELYRSMFNEYIHFVPSKKQRIYLTYDRQTYLREENNQVLLYAPSYGINEDIVLYDWTLEKSDTLQVGLYDEIERGKLFRVTDVSTVTLLDGKEYKKWTLACGIEYIEGIGAINGEGFGNYLCLQHTAHPATYIGSPLVCASRNGKILYQMDDAEMERLGAECLCDYNSGPKKDNAKNGKIGGRPTPTQWNQLELDLREMENGNTILRAETFSYTLENDSIVANNKTFYQLARQSTKDTAITKSFVGALHFGEDEDNRVYFLRDGVEYVLYDFTAEPGDTIEIFAGINNYPQETTYTHVVTGKDTLENGACRMMLEVVFPEGIGSDLEQQHLQKIWLAGLGSIDGIVHNAALRATKARSSDTQTSIMLCAWRDDNCLYTTDHPDYDTYGCVYNQDPTGVEDVQTSGDKYQKILRDGHLYILRDNKIYDVLGTPMN